jgi:hypothetical protein
MRFTDKDNRIAITYPPKSRRDDTLLTVCFSLREGCMGDVWDVRDVRDVRDGCTGGAHVRGAGERSKGGVINKIE